MSGPQKPFPWALDPAEVDPKWLGFWRNCIFCVPFWESTIGASPPRFLGDCRPNGADTATRDLTLVGSAGWSQNIYGPCGSFTSGTDDWRLPLDKNGNELIGVTRTTFLIVRKPNVLLSGPMQNWGLVGGSRAGAHCPYSDGNIYFDYGGSGAPNRLTWTGYVPQTANVEVWAFVAGTLGSAIYYNGQQVAVQTTAISRGGLQGVTIGINTGIISSTGGGCDQLFFAALDDEWTPGQVAEWAQDPFGPLRPVPILKAVPTGSAHGTSTVSGVGTSVFHQAPTFHAVAGITGNTSGSTAAPSMPTFSSGDIVVAWISVNTNSQINSNWNIGGRYNDANGSSAWAWEYQYNAALTTDPVKFAWTGSAAWHSQPLSITGAETFAPIGANNSAHGTVTPITIAALTPQQTSSFILAMQEIFANSQVIPLPTHFTNIAAFNDGFGSDRICYEFGSSAGIPTDAISNTITNASWNSWGAEIVAPLSAPAQPYQVGETSTQGGSGLTSQVLDCSTLTTAANDLVVAVCYIGVGGVTASVSGTGWSIALQDTSGPVSTIIATCTASGASVANATFSWSGSHFVSVRGHQYRGSAGALGVAPGYQVNSNAGSTTASVPGLTTSGSNSTVMLLVNVNAPSITPLSQPGYTVQRTYTDTGWGHSVASLRNTTAGTTTASYSAGFSDSGSHPWKAMLIEIIATNKGSASGVGGALGIGRAINTRTVAAAGISTVTGHAISSSVATAHGFGTGTAITAPPARATASGLAMVFGVGIGIRATVAHAAGTSTATAPADALVMEAGRAAGLSSAHAISVHNVPVVATAAGVGTALGRGAARNASVGTAHGGAGILVGGIVQGQVLGVSPPSGGIYVPPGVSGPFYFAWVDASETVFGPQHLRYDEQIFVATLEHTESNIPTLVLEIKNPRVGLLSSGRKQWAWFSWRNPATGILAPIFFGRLAAIPSNLFSEVIEIRLVARPTDYLPQKQKVAESLKVRPFYDPIFLDLAKRDDPDAILEGWSALYHVDRVSLVVSISDILMGEDGLEVFQPHDSFYDSLDLRYDQHPLTSVRVVANVGWNQASTGIVDIGNNAFISYSDGIFKEWPAPLTELGGGWSVFDSTAVDVYHVEHAVTANFKYEFHNADNKHEDGDVLSTSQQDSYPVLAGGSFSGVVSDYSQSGALDPFATDDDGDPAPVNIPLTIQSTSTVVPAWLVATSLKLRYQSDRQHTEYLTFTMKADVQAVNFDLTQLEQSELVSLNGADVGVELLQPENWLSVQHSPVAVGQIVAPDVGRPEAGGTSYQICTRAGVTGTIEPQFPDLPGFQTVDGGAIWTSLGTTTVEQPPDWVPAVLTPLGKMIIPRLRLWEYYSSLILPGLQSIPPVGVSVPLYRIVNANGSYQICTLSGVTNPFNTAPPFSGSYGSTVLDGTVEWTSLGTSLPQGTSMYICTQAGQTGLILPDFADHLGVGDSVVDGGAVWLSIGLAATFSGIPVGGTPGNVLASSFFPSDRGLAAAEYCLAVGRAHLRQRARSARCSFDIHYDRAINLSCRKNAQLFDPRLPGGQVEGKIIAYKAIANGDTNQLIGNVTLGVPVGNAGHYTSLLGQPTYVQEGYFNPGEVQQYTGGGTVPSGTDDISYTPPVATPDEDGLTFPLEKRDVVVVEAVHGTIADQEAGIASAIASQKALARLGSQPGSNPITNAINAAILGANTVEYQIKMHPIWYELQLKPVDGGPYVKNYELIVSPLLIRKGIDLEASSA